MSITSYYKVVNENKEINRALARTNICIEALKQRMGAMPHKTHIFEKQYGNEVLLILVNYIVQKYHKEYGVFAFSDGIERIFFDKQFEIVNNRLSILPIDKSRYYLCGEFTDNKEMLAGIINYAIHGFENIEKQVLEGLKEFDSIEPQALDREKVLTVYQIVTSGSCLGYFNVILDEQHLHQDERYIMNYFQCKEFLIKSDYCLFKIDILSGDLKIYNKSIKFEKWSNYNVGYGLEYLLRLFNKYRLNISLLEASIGGFGGPFYDVKIDLVNRNATYRAIVDFSRNSEEPKLINLDQKDISEFMYKLVEFNITNWKREYLPKHNILDGTSWNIEIVTEEGRFEHTGSNAYPKCWNRFCKSIEGLIKMDFR